MSSTTTVPLFEQLMDHSVRADPYPVYERMREHPVLLGSDGSFAVSRYGDVHALLRDRRISSDMRKSAAGDPVRRPTEPSFLLRDPPDHTRIRALVMKEFRPRMVQRLRSQIEEVVDTLIDAAAERGTLELVDDLAYPLPVTVICDLLGVPRADVPHFQHWSAMLAHSLDGAAMSQAERDEVARAVADMQGYMSELVAVRRTGPGDDYLSLLIHAEEDGHSLSEVEVVTTLVLLLVAGHETTVNLIANAMLALLRDPRLLEALRMNPGLAAAVVEETLRYDPPVQYRIRTCVEDIELRGTTIHSGSSIVLLLAGANRDPDRFPEPDTFDPNRDTAGHLGFGGGPHYCAGAGLARLEAQIALTSLAQRLHGPHLAVDPPPYRHNAALRGPQRLEISVEGFT